MNIKSNINLSLNYIRNNKKLVLSVFVYFLILSLINTVVSWSLPPGKTATVAFSFLIELLKMIGAIVILKHLFYVEYKRMISPSHLVWEAICDTPIFLFYNIVAGLHFLLGLVLFIIPSLYFLSRVYFAPYLSIVGELINDENDKGMIEWSKELTKDRIPTVLVYLILFNFIPLGLFAPLAWVDLGSWDHFVQLAICPFEMMIMIFGEIVFIHFFKEVLKKS